MTRNPALSSPEEILADARAGKMFILVDDEDRENEGDLVIPAQAADAAAINFMARHARGLICLALTEQRVGELGLQRMSPGNGTRHQTAFTVSIEAREGVTTGISAADRARTIQVAADPACGPQDIVTPGHVFPLAARDGGVLVRAGHTEAAVDVARMAGFAPAGVICEIMDADGSMARLPELIVFARAHDLRIGTIADLIAYRRQTEQHVACVATHPLDSQHGGDWMVKIYRNAIEGVDYLALVKGGIDPRQPTLVRMHMTTLFDDLLGRTGDRAHLLQAAMQDIGRHGAGVIVVVHHTRSLAYAELIEPEMRPRVPSLLRPPVVLREYGLGAQILVDLGVTDMILLTNSKQHQVIGLEAFGLNVVEERPIAALDRQGAANQRGFASFASATTAGVTKRKVAG